MKKCKTCKTTIFSYPEENKYCLKCKKEISEFNRDVTFGRIIGAIKKISPETEIAFSLRVNNGHTPEIQVFEKEDFERLTKRADGAKMEDFPDGRVLYKACNNGIEFSYLAEAVKNGRN